MKILACFFLVASVSLYSISGLSISNENSATTEVAKPKPKPPPPSPPPLPPPQSEFDYMQLTQQWAATVCRQKPKVTCKTMSPFPKVFTIHGLWPSNNMGISTQCPNQPSYQPSAPTGPLLRDLNLYWPSYEATNSLFWSHEWTQHGTCSNIAQIPYFTLAIERYKAYDLVKILLGAGIEFGSTHSAKEISDAIVRATKVRPILRCKPEGKIMALWEISLCLDKTATTFQNCTTLGNCRNQVVFLNPRPPPAEPSNE